MTMTCTSDRSGIASTGVRSIARIPPSETAIVARMTTSLWLTDHSMMRLSMAGHLLGLAEESGICIPGMSIPFMSRMSPEPIYPIIAFITSARFDSESSR